MSPLRLQVLTFVIAPWVIGLLGTASDAAGQDAASPDTESASGQNTAIQVERLTAQLNDGQWRERAEAAQGLAELGEDAAPAIEALHQAMQDEQPDVRAAAIQAVAATQAQPERSIELLFEALDDRNMTLGGRLVYTYAGQALGKYGDRVLDRLIEILKSENVTLVRGSAIALAEMGPDAAKAVPAIMRLLEKDQDATRIHALNALMSIGPAAQPALDLMIQALDHKDFHTQYWSCRALGGLGAGALPAVPKLLELTETGNVSVRRYAAQTLGQIGPQAGERVIEPLVKLVRDPVQPVRHDAIVALGKMGPLAASTAPVMEAALDDPFFESQARSQAAKTLWLIDADNERSLPTLLRELQSPDSPWTAAEILGEIGPKAGVVLDVIALLHAQDAETRMYAASALGEMGADAEQALPTLKDLESQDTDPGVRATAKAARVAIEGGRGKEEG